jgi:hypothetical protein
MEVSLEMLRRGMRRVDELVTHELPAERAAEACGQLSDAWVERSLGSVLREES